MTQEFTGLYVKDMVEALLKLPQDAPMYTAADDEGNYWFPMRYAPTASRFHVGNNKADSFPIDEDDWEAGEYEDYDPENIIDAVII